MVVRVTGRDAQQVRRGFRVVHFVDELIEPSVGGRLERGDVRCRWRLGGILKYYYREAA